MKIRILPGLFLPLIALAAAGAPHLLSAEKTSSGVQFDFGNDKARSANAAIMAYLGEPVSPPANLDEKYTPEGLTAAFTGACKKLGFRVQRLEIDDSEFPFLIYAKFSEQIDTRSLSTALRSMSDYAYTGSTSGTTRDGATFMALNIVPSDRYPHEHADGIRRRMMIRLQVLTAAFNNAAR